MVVLLSGLLPNPQLETSVLSISLNTCWMVYMISVGLGCAISTRVSNELGAGNAQGAVLALRVMIVIVIVEGTIIGFVTILVRNVWGKLYSNEDEVIKYVAKMMPLLALSDLLDGFQCVLSGEGLWMGIICGLFVQGVALVTVNACTDWDREFGQTAGKCDERWLEDREILAAQFHALLNCSEVKSFIDIYVQSLKEICYRSTNRS